MNFSSHIHPCRTARERDTAVRIAQHVAQAHAHDADDLVDDILFFLDKSGLEEAMLSKADDVRQVSIEGRLWLSWFPSALEAPARVPQDDTDVPFTLPAAAMRFGYNEKTLRIYVKKGWLRAGTNASGETVITDSAMRAFKDSLCKGTNGVNVERARARYRTRGFGTVKQQRRRTLVEQLRKPKAVRPERRSCLVATRAGLRFKPPGQPTLRPVRPAYPLQELVPLPLRRALVLGQDRATYPLAGNGWSPGGIALQRAGP